MLIRNVVAAMTAVSLAAASGAVQAENVVSVYLGNSSTRSSDAKIGQISSDSDANFHGVGWEGKDDEVPPYYGLRAAHFFEAAPNWGIALEFIHYKVYADPYQVTQVEGRWNGAPVNESAPLGSRVQNFSISHGVNLIALDAIYRFNTEPVPGFVHGRMHPYVGAGPVYYVLHPEITVNNIQNEEGYETSGFGYQALAGFDFAFTAHWIVFGEAKYTHGTAKFDVGGGGTAQTDLDTTHLVLGLSYAF